MPRDWSFDPRAPERCDPSDPTPVVTHVPDIDLDVDDRVRNIVRQLVERPPPPSIDDEPSEEELLTLEEAGDDLVLSPHQVEDMEPVEPPLAADLDQVSTAIAGLSAEDRAALVERLSGAPETGQGSSEPPSP